MLEGERLSHSQIDIFIEGILLTNVSTEFGTLFEFKICSIEINSIRSFFSLERNFIISTETDNFRKKTDGLNFFP